MTDKTEEAVEGAPLIEKDPVLVEINKKILEAFDIFDHENNKTVDVRFVQLAHIIIKIIIMSSIEKLVQSYGLWDVILQKLSSEI